MTRSTVLRMFFQVECRLHTRRDRENKWGCDPKTTTAQQDPMPRSSAVYLLAIRFHIAINTENGMIIIHIHVYYRITDQSPSAVAASSSAEHQREIHRTRPHTAPPLLHCTADTLHSPLSSSAPRPGIASVSPSIHRPPSIMAIQRRSPRRSRRWCWPVISPLGVLVCNRATFSTRYARRRYCLLVC